MSNTVVSLKLIAKQDGAVNLKVDKVAEGNVDVDGLLADSLEITNADGKTKNPVDITAYLTKRGISADISNKFKITGTETEKNSIAAQLSKDQAKQSIIQSMRNKLSLSSVEITSETIVSNVLLSIQEIKDHIVTFDSMNFEFKIYGEEAREEANAVSAEANAEAVAAEANAVSAEAAAEAAEAAEAAAGEAGEAAAEAVGKRATADAARAEAQAKRATADAATAILDTVGAVGTYVKVKVKVFPQIKLVLDQLENYIKNKGMTNNSKEKTFKVCLQGRDVIELNDKTMQFLQPPFDISPYNLIFDDDIKLTSSSLLYRTAVNLKYTTLYNFDQRPDAEQTLSIDKLNKMVTDSFDLNTNIIKKLDTANRVHFYYYPNWEKIARANGRGGYYFSPMYTFTSKKAGEYKKGAAVYFLAAMFYETKFAALKRAGGSSTKKRRNHNKSQTKRSKKQKKQKKTKKQI